LHDLWKHPTLSTEGAELLSFDAHFAAVDGLVWTRLGVPG
jgi:hypothetical protein